MADKKQEEADMWVAWTRDALKSFDMPEDLDIEDAEGLDALIDDMADISTQYADAMMDAFMERFGPEEGGRTRRRKKRAGRRARDDAESGD